MLSHDALLEKGITKTVYSICFPEVEAVFAQIFREEQREVLPRFHDAYSKKQDNMHHEFADAWKSFASPVVSIPANLKHFYPTAGSSEAIREQIVYIASQGGSLAVFEGEYEGYEVIAAAVGMRVTKIKRSDWRTAVPLLRDKTWFFISQPSAIDGRFWLEWDDFIAELTHSPQIRLAVDFCYVGSVANIRRIFIDTPNLEVAFFSLSKIFGVYYHRMGGVFSRQVNPLLYGNMWFKNLLSLYCATRLLNSFNVVSLPRKYLPIQLAACDTLSARFGVTVEPADVLLLGNAYLQGELKESLCRSAGNWSRICLTPTIEGMIREKS